MGDIMDKVENMFANKSCGGHALRIAVGITMMTILLLAGGAGAATLTVDDSGGANYTRIQDAIDNASAGDTILVYSGTYFGNVNVNKRLILRGIGRPVVDARGSGSAITLAADEIILEGFTATRATIGISVTSNNNTLIGNNASSNTGYYRYSGNGIYLYSSSNNTLIRNNANSNTGTSGSNGIYLYSSRNNTLIGNNASSNTGYRLYSGHGIYLDYSSNNTLIGNNASLNTGPGISLDSSSNNRIYNNIFNNTNNVQFYDPNINSWNTTLQFSPNIIGGPTLGGNFWAYPNGTGFSQTCSDNDKDGICDSPYTLDSNNIDSLPLALHAAPSAGVPDISSFSPTTSTVTNNVGESRTFSITTNQTVNVSWFINGTEALNEIGVTTSSYTNSSAALGTWNVTAIASNAKGSAMQTWDWIVTSVPTTNSVHNINKGTDYTSIQPAINDANLGDEIHVDSGTYFENIVVDKSLTIQGESRDTTIIHAFNSDEPVFRVTADYVNISGFKAEGATNFGLASGGIAGIQLYRGSDYSNILNNNVTNNSFGIVLWESKNNNISNNIANLNIFDGINLYYFSNNNTLSNNIAESNKEHGISLTVNSYSNILSGNIAGSNKYSGIAFYYSNANTLYNNIVSNNMDGISLSVSNSNIIYNNYFNNTNNFLSYISTPFSNNTWNTTKTQGTNIIGGSYLGGNFWANPNGTGFSQTCSDSDKDGICNSLYILDSNNTDLLPLASPSLIAGIISGYKINDTNGNGKWDAGEAGIQGWNITLKNVTTGKIIASNLTDNNGFYIFANLANGIYNVTEEIRTGFIPTNATFKLVNVAGQNVMNLNFTNQPPGSNLIQNPGFESGTSPWLFYTNGTGKFTATPPGYEGSKSANIVLYTGGTNIQLYQKGISLEPKTRYRLSFAAYSTRGHDLKVALIKHISPYTVYGLYQTFNLSVSWQEFSTEFTTSGFSATVNDGRLMFFLAPYAKAGDTYYIDYVRLEKI
ncbi:MAG: hypothetical protein FIB07_14570 [Candidatus Methanoperedens sp.]|nr:hypothetical protein [Candidatus Methanoperedens sp.]